MTRGLKVGVVCAAVSLAGCSHDSCERPAASPAEATPPAAEPAPEAPAAPAEPAPAEGAEVTAPEAGAERGTVGAESAAEAETDVAGGTTLYLRCGDEGPTFTARLVEKEAQLSLPNGKVVLPRVESASGERFSNGDFQLWRKGDSAIYQNNAGQKFNCSNDTKLAVWQEAGRRGVEMRAVGDERGGWVLEQTLTTMTLTTTEGLERVEIPTPDSKGYIEGDRASYWGRDGDTLMRVSREPKECVDERTGEKFDVTIEISLNGQALHGCGRDLSSLGRSTVSGGRLPEF